MDLRAAESVMGAINNWFVRKKDVGDFTVADGVISGDFDLMDGQYYRVRGSVFNDGLHRYPESDLVDETFTGEIWELAVPAGFEELVGRIGDYQTSIQVTPFTSESFGGYSYTKATDANGAPLSWQSAFASELNRYRRLPCS